MAYMDEHGGKDSAETKEKLHGYQTESEEVSTESQASKQHKKSTKTESSQSTNQAQGGLLSRLRRTLFGDQGVGEKVKKGLFNWRMSGSGGVENGASKLVKMVARFGAPKILAALVLGSGLGVFSILGIFTTYKNDGVVKNDPPLQCEEGVLELPGASSDDEDIQAVVDVMYDIFCVEMGFSKEALGGMLACMIVESNINPNRLESDYLLKSDKEIFDTVAGPDMKPASEDAKQAYWTYGEAFRSGGGWNNNEGGYIVDGHMCCGVGLIQWTAGRGNAFFEGLDKLSEPVSPMSIQYQCAYLIYEMTSNPSYAECHPEDGSLKDAGTVQEATEIFFTTMVSGGVGGELLEERIQRIPDVMPYIQNAAANSEFRDDIVTMSELLTEEGFASSVAKSNKIQLCVNNTYISTADIANAAVSISFLERGEYEDVHGAYGMYRRATRSPVMINDWDWVEGMNGGPGPGTYGGSSTYGDKFGDEAGAKKTWTYYDVSEHGAGGKLDLIACTEYYYFAHMIAFPKETGTGGQAGYFSSCDRGTATAVRIAGADDKFPAGNPLAQLAHAVGAKKIGSQHDSDRRGTQGAGFLWEFAGFLRGCDYYSASGSPSISPGTVMISWNVKAANGMLTEAMGGATTGGVGEEGGVVGEDGDLPDDTTDNDDINNEIVRANLRWPLAITNTTRHIITFVGEGTVQKFWGMEWLYQQWTLFDDTDSLIRGDLTVEVPEIMSAGMAFKAKTAKKASDQKATFYDQEMEGARTTDDVKETDITAREMSFNGKTGLPTFRAWEQIFVRLIHNSDDDAAAKLLEDKDLYNEFNVDEDHYLDEADDPDRIEQYQAWNSNADKWFYEDWNSVGMGDPADPKSNGEDDYAKVEPDSGTLPYADEGNDKWTWYDGDSHASNPFWRYELITDIEYRMNQFLRFGMASFMCSLPSEEDAGIYQSGTDGNDTGHIIGNIYRRYSRIPDDTDVSGRYYYYNTVVSNDMLQDLTQLWSHDRNGDSDNEQGGGGYDARNFGPMYLFNQAGTGMAAYADQMKSQTYGFLDRRYGLTAKDVENIMGGLDGMMMGSNVSAVNEYLKQAITVPMHDMTAANDTNLPLLTLYDRRKQSDEEANTDKRGAHEGSHLYSADKTYDTDIYGLNPFLMLEAEDKLGTWDAEYLNMNPGQADWSVDGKAAGSARMSAGTEVSDGVDGNSEDVDGRLAWIDRHYTYGPGGSINMLAYQIAGLNPSTGYKVSSSGYENALKASKTLDATATDSRGEHGGQTDADNLFGSWKKIRYTDFIYGETKNANEEMAKRLFGGDDRQGDTGLPRDDYNRREYIVIPYYHTHAQMCDHADLEEYGHEKLICEWWGNDPANSATADVGKIDTQTWLNGQPSSQDYGDTISFHDKISNRNKYDLTELIAAGEVRFFTDFGGEILVDDRPYIHVLCNGWQQSVGCGCLVCICTEATCPNRERCHACNGWVWCKGPHNHSCDECLEYNYCHDHKECDGGINVGIDNTQCDCNEPNGSPLTQHDTGDQGYVDYGTNRKHYTGVGSFNMDEHTDDCHEKYGCNAMEFFYHNPGEKAIVTPNGTHNGKDHDGGSEWIKRPDGTPATGETVEALYMVIQVVKNPVEEFDIENWMIGGKVVPDKANLLQRVYYEPDKGFVEYNWEAMTDGREGALSNPRTDGSYDSVINYINVSDARWDESKAGMPIGANDKGNMFGEKTLFGIFTIEGNIIKAGVPGEQSETIESVDDNCETEDFQRLESIRNRVGFGKSVSHDVDGSGVNVSQSSNPAVADSGLEPVEFDPSDHGENGVNPEYGYGEVAITGTQHGLDPTPVAGAYSGNAGQGSGPDGSKGNANNSFGNSLLREILGDEHVQHVRFGSQDLARLTDENIDNGRDFKYYVNGKRWAEHLEAHGFDRNDEVESMYFKPEYYQKPGNTCPGDGCGEVIIVEPEEMQTRRDWLAHPGNNNVDGSVGGQFRDLDDDKLYLDPQNNVPTDKKYFDELKKACTDDKTNDLGQPNKKNKKLLPKGINNDEQLTNSGLNGSAADGAMNNGAANDGDYNLWVTHASRGTRGMMTQYLNFKSFFKDASSGTANGSANMYMLFTNIKRSDTEERTDHETEHDRGKTSTLDPAPVLSGHKGSGNADRDNDTKEDFVYSNQGVPSPPGDAVDMNPHRVWGVGSVEIKDDDGNVIGYKPANFSDTYGQGANSHWKNLIDIYNAAMSETRHFD